jgi:hypothetical protein
MAALACRFASLIYSLEKIAVPTHFFRKIFVFWGNFA